MIPPLLFSFHPFHLTIVPATTHLATTAAYSTLVHRRCVITCPSTLVVAPPIRSTNWNRVQSTGSAPLYRLLGNTKPHLSERFPLNHSCSAHHGRLPLPPDSVPPSTDDVEGGLGQQCRAPHPAQRNFGSNYPLPCYTWFGCRG